MKYEMIFGDDLFAECKNDKHMVAVYYKPMGGRCHPDIIRTYRDLADALNTGIPHMHANEVSMRRAIKDHRHSDDINVDAFAECMKGKLDRSRNNGRGGWETCKIEFLSSELKRHVDKGDPIDVANFAMMIHQRGEKIKQTEPKRWTVEDWKDGRLPDVGCMVMVTSVDECASVAAINNDAVCVVFHDGEFTTLHKSGISPIETPEGKAERLRSEWINKAYVDFHRLGCELEVLQKEQIKQIYDALPSGELTMPGKVDE